MANQTKLTRVVIYLNPKRAQCAKKLATASGHKNVNRFADAILCIWLDRAMK